MYRTEERALGPAVSRLGGLLLETLTGGLVGALGGALCGVLFGAFCWAAFGRASAVWAAEAHFLWACAAAGVVASLSIGLSDPEPLGWAEWLPRRATGRVGPTSTPRPHALWSGAGLILRTTGQAMRIPGAPPAGSTTERVNIDPPETRLR